MVLGYTSPDQGVLPVRKPGITWGIVTRGTRGIEPESICQRRRTGEYCTFQEWSCPWKILAIWGLRPASPPVPTLGIVSGSTNTVRKFHNPHPIDIRLLGHHIDANCS